MDKLMDWLWPLLLGLVVVGALVHDFTQHLEAEREKDRAREAVEVCHRRIEQIHRMIEALERRFDANGRLLDSMIQKINEEGK